MLMYWAMSCVYTRWGIDIQVLCALCQGCKDSASLFCWQTSLGPGAAAVLQLHCICCQDLPLAFWVLCFKWCFYFHTIMILPLLCALKPFWLLKCSIWDCSVTAAYKIVWAVLPSKAARDFRGILWTFIVWQFRLKSICSGKAEEPVVPFRCHRKWLHPAWNMGLVTWKCSQKALVLPSSSGGKSVVLNYNFKRKKNPHLLQHKYGWLLVCFL